MSPEQQRQVSAKLYTQHPSEADSLRGEVATLRTENEQLRQRVKELQEKLSSSEKGFGVVCGDLQHAQEENEQLRQRVKELEAALDLSSTGHTAAHRLSLTAIQQLTAMLEKVEHAEVDYGINGIPYHDKENCPRCAFEAWKKGETK